MTTVIAKQKLAFLDELCALPAEDIWISSKDSIFSAILADAGSILLLGNGPISEAGARRVRTHAAKNDVAVIRMNNWKVSGACSDVEPDITAVCSAVPSDVYQNSSSEILLMDCHSRLWNYKQHKLLNHSTMVQRKVWSHLCTTASCTRGFLTLCLLRRTTSVPIYLAGFGGDGHASNSRALIMEGIKSEHMVLGKLLKDEANAIYHLDEKYCPKDDGLANLLSKSNPCPTAGCRGTRRMGVGNGRVQCLKCTRTFFPGSLSIRLPRCPHGLKKSPQCKVTKFGTFRGVQRFYCSGCRRYFTWH